MFFVFPVSFLPHVLLSQTDETSCHPDISNLKLFFFFVCVCVSCEDVNISDVLLLCTNVKRKKGISQKGDGKQEGSGASPVKDKQTEM